MALPNWIQRLLAAIADLITRVKGLDDIHDDLGTALTSQGRQLFSMDFWSASIEEAAIPAVAADVALTSVVVEDLPAGATIVRAIAMIKFRMVENTNVAGNGLDGASVHNEDPDLTTQTIQVKVHDAADATYIDAIEFVDDQFTLAAETREGGDIVIGDINVAAVVTANDPGGYTLRWNLAKSHGDFLNLNDVQMGIKILYSI